MSFDNHDDSDDKKDDDNADDEKYDADADTDADDALAGDDPPVAIPGCSTKASQFQVNNILLKYNHSKTMKIICFTISAKSLQKFSTNTSTHISPIPIQGSQL